MSGDDIFGTKHPTFGPDYDPKVDHPQIKRQHEAIKDLMLDGEWRTLAEIEHRLGYPQSSISAQLRHLRKDRFGAYQMDKRRRATRLWEYQITEPSGQGELF